MGLIGALRQASYAAISFKVSLDFIDPCYHAVAVSRPDPQSRLSYWWESSSLARCTCTVPVVQASR